MKKRILAIICTICLCATSVMPALAQDVTTARATETADDTSGETEDVTDDATDETADVTDEVTGEGDKEASDETAGETTDDVISKDTTENDANTKVEDEGTNNDTSEGTTEGTTDETVDTETKTEEAAKVPLTLKGLWLEQNSKKVEGDFFVDVTDTFNLAIEVEEPEGAETDFYEVEFIYDVYKDGKKIATKYFYDDDLEWESAENGNVYRLPVKFKSYDTDGEYRLSEVYLDYETKDGWDEMTYKRDDNNQFACQGITYDCENVIDFTVNENAEADTTAPVPLSFTMKNDSTDGIIYTNTDVKFKLKFKEEGKSGLEDAELVFKNEEQNHEELFCSDDWYEEGEAVGTKTTTLVSWTWERKPGTYKLTLIGLYDYAGNYVQYEVVYPEALNGEPAISDGTDGYIKLDTILSSFVYEYEVKPAEYARPTITKIAVQDGAKNLTGGESVELTVTLKNNTDEYITISPADWNFTWEGPKDKYGYEEDTTAGGTGDEFELAPGKTGKVKAVLDTSLYTYTGERKLDEIVYYLDEAGTYVYYERVEDADAGTVKMVGKDSWGQELGEFTYNGGGDYNITSAQTDDEAPLLDSITVLTENVKAPGEVQFLFKFQDEGNAKFCYASLYFEDVERENNTLAFYGEGAGIEYSEEYGGYIVTLSLGKTDVAATYKLTSVKVGDAAEQDRWYELNKEETKLVEYEWDDTANDDIATENQIDPVQLVIVESECQDYDFADPVLTALTVPNSGVPEAVYELEFKATDESGISSIELSFSNDDMEMNLDVIPEITEVDGDTYRATFTLPKYLKTGRYNLEYVKLTDKSNHENYSILYYDAEKNVFEDDDEKVFPVEGENFYIDITQLDGLNFVSSSETELLKALEAAKDGATLIIIDSLCYLTWDMLYEIEDKNLTLKIIANDLQSELLLKGSQIPDIWGLPDEIYVGLGTDSVAEEVEIGKDILKYPDDTALGFTVLCSEPTLPLTARVKVPDEFAGKGLHLFKLDWLNDEVESLNEIYTLEKSFCMANSSGYVVISLSDGVGKEYMPIYAISTKLNTTCEGEHDWDNGHVTKSATCQTTGTKVYVCHKCAATKSTTIKKCSHTYQQVVTKKATMKTDGKVEYRCKWYSSCKKKQTSKSFTVAKIKSVTLSKTSYTYNGKVKKPTVTVKNKYGKTIDPKYYTVTYQSGRKNVGQYKVTIKFKGRYSGTVTKTFKIVPKSTSINKLTAGKKNFTVKWNKRTVQTTGIEIRYSRDSKFKTYSTKRVLAKNTSKKVTGLRSGSKYYVKVRTYKTVKINGKSTRIYSAWSKVKTVRTK